MGHKVWDAATQICPRQTAPQYRILNWPFSPHAHLTQSVNAPPPSQSLLPGKRHCINHTTLQLRQFLHNRVLSQVLPHSRPAQLHERAITAAAARDTINTCPLGCISGNKIPDTQQQHLTATMN
ncbi:hypothetical protein E2C01_034619 [Portunus trituberculatus]|uniref:Uncharacterized protein n=1 Tax=Portunus trituberculatus TaxID=210409 RepID=A0A5B7F739_PORTR|nr:hypothetical protein [Portunus trituberculatus]